MSAPTLHAIIAEVCKRDGFTADQVKIRGLSHDVQAARAEICWRAQQLRTPSGYRAMSDTQIGRDMGGRASNTVRDMARTYAKRTSEVSTRAKRNGEIERLASTGATAKQIVWATGCSHHYAMQIVRYWRAASTSDEHGSHRKAAEAHGLICCKAGGFGAIPGDRLPI